MLHLSLLGIFLVACISESRMSKTQDLKYLFYSFYFVVERECKTGILWGGGYLGFLVNTVPSLSGCFIKRDFTACSHE